MIIRRFENTDAVEVSALIVTTLRTTNIKDYSQCYSENEILQLQPEHILQRAGWMHLYVVCEEKKIIGCGGIGPFWGKTDESGLFNIFVHPVHQRQGVGRAIIETLEEDDYFTRARRVEIPASITGTPFYLKMGYSYKNGVTVPDEEGLIRLEKYKDEEGMKK